MHLSHFSNSTCYSDHDCSNSSCWASSTLPPALRAGHPVAAGAPRRPRPPDRPLRRPRARRPPPKLPVAGAGVWKRRGGGCQCRVQSPSRRRRATARHSRPEVGARRPQGAEASTQRPRIPLCIEVGPSAGREQGRLWVSLLRGRRRACTGCFPHAKFAKSAKSAKVGFQTLPLRTWRTLREISTRRRAACGGVRGAAPPMQIKKRTAEYRWMPRSERKRLRVPAGLCVPFKHGAWWPNSAGIQYPNVNRQRRLP